MSCVGGWKKDTRWIGGWGEEITDWLSEADNCLVQEGRIFIWGRGKG